MPIFWVGGEHLGNSKEKMIYIKPKNIVAGFARHNIFGISVKKERVTRSFFD
jgi:hypothetical protein